MKVVLSPMSFWFHDLCSCLQDCIATVLLYYGHDPILTMGASWEFYHDPAQVSREEFYHPLPRPTLAQSMMPFHPLTSTWHQSDDPEAAWRDVKAMIAQQKPVIVAVDNFYMPIRPAYGDVHAAHLMVAFGFDDDADEVYLLESTPPQFRGPLPVTQFLIARNSDNPIVGERDFFFTGTPIKSRWLQLEIHEPFPDLTRAWVMEVVSTNLSRFHAPSSGPAWSGLEGLQHYLYAIGERATGPDAGVALQELYTVGWTAQGAAALHADFLMQAGHRLDWPRLTEVGRHVERIANEWTTLRMLGAHGFSRPADVAERLRRRTVRFLADHEQTLKLLDWALHPV
ncbi:MAG TPA: BtrH N-terminal domain-containing protein [Herpetosiphonaceae bacterium]